MKLQDFKPAHGYELLESTMFDDIVLEVPNYIDNFKARYNKDTRVRAFEAKMAEYPTAKIYKYDDIVPLAGSKGYILVDESDEIVSRFVLWMS